MAWRSAPEPRFYKWGEPLATDSPVVAALLIALACGELPYASGRICGCTIPATAGIQADCSRLNITVS
jgi:hypothetical protein